MDSQKHIHLELLKMQQHMGSWAEKGPQSEERKLDGTSASHYRKYPDFLAKETHLRAECLPERVTLLPTGEGRLLPLCKSSMDLLQGLDFSTELSTVLSTFSKSKLK